MSDYDPGPPMAYPFILDGNHDPVSYTAADPKSILYKHGNALIDAKSQDSMLRGDQSRAELSLTSLVALGSRYDEPSLADWDRAYVVALERLARLRESAGIHAHTIATQRRNWATALAAENAKIVVGGDEVPANPKLVRLARVCWPRYYHHIGSWESVPPMQDVQRCAACGTEMGK